MIGDIGEVVNGEATDMTGGKEEQGGKKEDISHAVKDSE